jgi:hypothetical protein
MTSDTSNANQNKDATSSTTTSSSSSERLLPNKNNPHHRPSTAGTGSPSTVVSMMMEVDDYGGHYHTQQPLRSTDQDDVDETSQVRVEPGTHDELMYALGVNLARQLGDIRPLVESGEELAHVAKGLLDTVVGRLSDDAQRLLLSSRGKELDQMILTRA